MRHRSLATRSASRAQNAFRDPTIFPIVAPFRVTREGKAIVSLTPERRYYPVEGRWTTEAAIHTTWLADLYAVLGERPDGEGPWAVRLYHNPLVPWIWIGAILAALGGGLALADRRYRVKDGPKIKTMLEAEKG